MDEYNEEWCTVGPWFNEKIFQSLHGHFFEEFFVTAHQDRYDLMCVLHANDKPNYKSTGATYFYSDRPVTEYLSVSIFVSLCVTINFIGIWIKTLDKNIACCCLAYQNKTKEIFKNYYRS